ncbi:hypothetical protein MWN41_06815, partial [Ornithobacterium rhinotracheale]|uniref:SpvB/TcaC N-terminal domain-containing protein n=1 Tax=Ornithobacterium rhinotracheale TaxID=28251 RepID=UPI001FF642FE
MKKKEYLKSENKKIFFANLKSGNIGSLEGEDADDITDNLFHVEITKIPSERESVYLEYDVSGYSAISVSRSINNQQSVGGNVIIKNDSWQTNRELIPSQLIRKGDNTILFTAPRKGFYRVRNLRIRYENKVETAVNYQFYKFKNIYYLKAQFFSEAIKQVKLNQEIIDVTKGREIEREWKGLNASLSIVVQYKNGKIEKRNVQLSEFKPIQDYIPLGGNVFTLYKKLRLEAENKLDYKGISAKFPIGSISKDLEISVTALRNKDIPALSSDLVNVTRDVQGYRLLPHGVQFDKAVSLEIFYDEHKIPSGYTAKDIDIFFFDEKKTVWQKIPKDSVLFLKNKVKANTTHFTDFIAGILKQPESPETSGFTPTSISGLKTAFPLVEVQPLNVPKVNSKGSVFTSFSIQLPNGRSGMQPELNIQYSGNEGQSWLGTGWNLILPSVSIDTRWGAPRYDIHKETESYLLNSTELLPNSHRREWENRSAEKQFYSRLEGSFQEIKRNGNIPKNYHWTVRSKNGVTSYYGGTGTGVEEKSILRNKEGNIGFWALSKQKDLRGNTIYYEYKKEKNILYPKSIYYTGKNDEKGLYSIHFITDKDLGESLRKDIQIFARLGLKQEYNQLLRKIEIRFQGQLIRRYELIYKEGAFNKTLLSEIKVYDANGVLFYSNRMDYYDDIRDNSGNYVLFGKFRKWEVPKSNIGYPFLGIKNFSGHPTLAGTSSSESKGSSFRLGVGGPSGSFNINTIGALGGFSRGKTQSKVFLQDIDGDNLPDKIYLKNNKVYYLKNLSSQGDEKFSEKEIYINLPNLGVTKSFSNNYGVDLQLRGSSFGYNKQISKSTTESYFMDFNGDGLLDFANGGVVYYNHLVNGVPTFSLNSSGTPVPINASGNTLELEGVTTITKEELEKANPLHDVVRTWEVPFTGDLRVEHRYQLIEDTSEDRGNYKKNDGAEKADGVILYFQKGGNLIWKDDILASDYTVKNKTNTLSVKKGEILYFRVSSKYDGNYDRTFWTPRIEYINIQKVNDVNGLNLKHYTPDKEMLFSSSKIFSFENEASPKLKGTFRKSKTTDDVKLKILKIDIENGSASLISEKVFSAEQELDYDLSAISLGNFMKAQGLKIIIESPTEINWKNISLFPTVEYSDITGAKKEEKLNVEFKNYRKIDEYYLPNYLVSKSKGKLRLLLEDFKQSLPHDLSGDILITAKQEGKVVARKKYKINQGAIKSEELKSSFPMDSVQVNQKIFVELNLSNEKIYDFLRSQKVNVIASIKDSVKQTSSKKYEIRKVEQKFFKYAVFVPFEITKNTQFGKGFRGWGSFILNGNKAGDTIDESRLKDSYGKVSDEEGGEPNLNTDNPELKKGSSMEFSNIYFMRTAVDYVNKQSLGLESDIYLSSKEFSPSRLGENDLEAYLDTSLPALQGDGGKALKMVTESKSNAYAIGVTALGGSYSEGNSVVLETMSDFNGDRFPDFVRGGEVQYTTPRGGISVQRLSIGNFSESTMSTKGGSMNGGFQHGSAKSSLTYEISKNAQQKNTLKSSDKDIDKAKNSMSVSGGLSEGKDNANYIYTDMNGDGLADRITNDGKIAYNIGYGFLPEETWSEHNAEITHGKNIDRSAGLGYSILAGSFSGGLNYSNSKTENKVQILDINGDGLADKINYENSDYILIYLNLGNTWSETPIKVKKEKENPIAVNRSVSYGGSAKFSVYFRLLFIRLGITTGGFLGKSTSRVEAAFMDIDGDGYLDYVLSDGEDDLRVARSNFRRTNLLKRVENATGSVYDLDYEWKPPTYENPNSHWVLKEVKVFDGHKGDGEDYSIMRYHYRAPHYDRRERSFYGYGEIVQEQIDPNDGSILRSTTQDYYNQDFYRQSLMKSSYTLDKEGNRLSESSIFYKVTNAQTGEEIPPLALTTPQVDNISIFVAPIKTIEKQYEGSKFIAHQTEQVYDKKGNIIQYTDKGNGTPESALLANISYYENTEPYYAGIPKDIEVRDLNGLVRKRTAEIDPSTTELKRLIQYSGANQTSVTDFSYDTYGNIAQVISPENEKGQRATIAYTYDEAVHSFITKITDQFGYNYTTAYDYKFGVPISVTDRNGETIRYTIDAKGRVKSILAPKEAEKGLPYTIKYEYYPKAKVPYAKTYNYDAEHGKDIATYVYTDALGRTLQVKKTAAIFKGKDIPDEEKLIVSGKQIYDALGRVVKTYYPTTETPTEAFNTTQNTIEPTTIRYDTKDRVIEQVLPDGSSQTTAYELADKNGISALQTTTTDALGRSSATYTDVMGRTLAQVQPTGIETQYEYNALGEILKVTDAEGHETLSEYDWLGRRTKLTHPDAGTTSLAYDAAGNLIRRQTAQIRAEMPSAAIQYAYEYNRLQEIRYPKHSENNVRYHYGKAEDTPSRRGRLWLVEDASGGTEYFYGNMGEITKEIRSIRIKPTETQSYVTEYEYDSWNRIQKMVYPDGEVLDYAYNRAGKLTGLTGKKGNYTYTYIKQQGYDEFEQKVYRRYGNDTETHYTYDAVMRRLTTLQTSSPVRQIQNNQYHYDPVGN